MRANRAATLLVSNLIVAASAATAQTVAFIGNEFQVNTYTAGAQIGPGIARENNGDFVVVWQSEQDQDGEGKGVFGQRFSSSGAPLGAELQINVYTTNQQ